VRWKLVARGQTLMLNNKTLRWVACALFVIVGLMTAPNIFSRSAPGKISLTGMVKSSDGKPLAGVGVSARCDAQTFTTTVYTDQSGMYSFPQLGPGAYRIWAQAVGFDADVKETTLTTGQSSRVGLTLAPLKDFS